MGETEPQLDNTFSPSSHIGDGLYLIEFLAKGVLWKHPISLANAKAVMDLYKQMAQGPTAEDNS